MHYPGGADFSDHSPHRDILSGIRPSETRGNGFATAECASDGAATNTFCDAVNGRSPGADKDIGRKSDGIIPETALDRACAEIFARWSRFVPENEAREQTEAFRRHVEALAAKRLLTENEFDATLAIVADAMAAA